MKRLLFIGATSAIATAVARFLCNGESRYLLVGRSAPRLQDLAADLRVRGAASVNIHVMDFATEDWEALTVQADDTLGGIDLALVAHGSLPDQQACEHSSALTMQQMEVNALSVVRLLTPLANYFEAQGHGTLAVLGSVAGDRGRRSNYAYAASKAMVATYLQGLRLRLLASGVNVVTVKPGFVDTPMTDGFPKGILWSQPNDVAPAIATAIRKGQAVAYVPGYWRYIMLVVRCMPEAALRRLNI